MYTDDIIALILGVNKVDGASYSYACTPSITARGGLTCAWRSRHLGVSAPFIGANILTDSLCAGARLRRAPSKVLRTDEAIRSAIAGDMCVAEGVKLVGLLNHPPVTP